MDDLKMKETLTTTCKHCVTRFTKKRTDSRFCSKSCANAYNYDLKKRRKLASQGQEATHVQEVAESPLKPAESLGSRKPRQKRSKPVWLQEAPDLSDVQELRVKIRNRDGCLLDPVHKRMLHCLEVDVALGKLSRMAYDSRAGRIWKLPQAVPAEVLKAEAVSLKSPEEFDRKMAAQKAESEFSGPYDRDRWGFVHRDPAGTREPLAMTT
jgi:hypothetical protein